MFHMSTAHPIHFARQHLVNHWLCIPCIVSTTHPTPSCRFKIQYTYLVGGRSAQSTTEPATAHNKRHHPSQLIHSEGPPRHPQAIRHRINSPQVSCCTQHRDDARQQVPEGFQNRFPRTGNRWLGSKDCGRHRSPVLEPTSEHSSNTIFAATVGHEHPHRR